MEVILSPYKNELLSLPLIMTESALSGLDGNSIIYVHCVSITSKEADLH